MIAQDQNDLEIRIPKSLKEAISSKYSDQWQQAFDREYNALMENKVWELTSLPEGKKAIRSQWLFSIKTRSDGTLDRFKARLVILGNLQKFGVDKP